LPSGLLLPLTTHTEVVWRLKEQIAVSKPTCKRLWKQIVVAKIEAQAGNLAPDDPSRRRLLQLTGTVKSGDTTNVEAHAAKVYWSSWLRPDAGFHRDPSATDPVNSMLNYGYTVMRAALGRALVAAGLHPALGLHHANRSNAFCLADDLLETLRPLVDGEVRDLHRHGQGELNRTTKQALLSLLTTTVTVADQSGPLLVALHRTVSSLVDCYEGRETRLLIPRWSQEQR
jgi:CRISPR-associated protein Cas1